MGHKKDIDIYLKNGKSLNAYDVINPEKQIQWEADCAILMQMFRNLEMRNQAESRTKFFILTHSKDQNSVAITD